MKLYLAICAFVLLSGGAARAADDFKLRIGEANMAARTPNGAAYEKALGPAAQTAIQSCIPPGTAPPGSTGKFIFVAEVSASGVVSKAAVQPETAVSQCFAKAFSAQPLPPPPGPASTQFEYPIVVEMDITP